MPLQRAFAPVRPEFDSFLFATVGEELDGVPLSVLSRLGLDLRDEAARLSHLTKEAAADQLARMIARLSDRCWTLPEARRIAGGLVERLPTSSPAGKPHRLERGTGPTPGFRASRPVYAASLIALLVGLIAGGFLSGAIKNITAGHPRAAASQRSSAGAADWPNRAQHVAQ